MGGKTAVIALSVVLVAVALAAAPRARALCVAISEPAAMARAEVAFEGVALQGPAADGALLSPARFRVTEYLKGSGPDVVRVTTGTTRQGRYISHVSEGIDPRAGETWRIYGRGSPERVLRTSACDRSARLSEASAPGGAGPPESAGDDRSSSWPVALGSGLALLAIAGLAAAGRRQQRAMRRR